MLIYEGKNINSRSIYHSTLKLEVNFGKSWKICRSQKSAVVDVVLSCIRLRVVDFMYSVILTYPAISFYYSIFVY